MRAHPRSRGENVVKPGSLILEPGSSPLTRGKLGGVRPTHLRKRLIPAHAGKTGTMPGAGPFLWAHPRSRGENRILKPGGYLLAGSSPLTRGKREDHTP